MILGEIFEEGESARLLYEDRLIVPKSTIADFLGKRSDKEQMLVLFIHSFRLIPHVDPLYGIFTGPPHSRTQDMKIYATCWRHLYQQDVSV